MLFLSCIVLLFPLCCDALRVCCSYNLPYGQLYVSTFSLLLCIYGLFLCLFLFFFSCVALVFSLIDVVSFSGMEGFHQASGDLHFD